MIKITLVKKDVQSLLKGINNIEKVIYQQCDALPKEGSEDYQSSVKNAILSQKYTFAPLSKKYVVYKKKKVGHQDFWRLTGDVVSNITSVPISNSKKYRRYFGGLYGFNGGGGGVLKYAVAVEYGYSQNKLPSRPLFKKAYEDFKPVWDLMVKKSADKYLGTWGA